MPFCLAYVRYMLFATYANTSKVLNILQLSNAMVVIRISQAGKSKTEILEVSNQALSRLHASTNFSEKPSQYPVFHMH